MYGLRICFVLTALFLHNCTKCNQGGKFNYNCKSMWEVLRSRPGSGAASVRRLWQEGGGGPASSSSSSSSSSSKRHSLALCLLSSTSWCWTRIVPAVVTTTRSHLVTLGGDEGTSRQGRLSSRAVGARWESACVEDVQVNRVEVLWDRQHWWLYLALLVNQPSCSEGRCHLLGTCSTAAFPPILQFPTQPLQPPRKQEFDFIFLSISFNFDKKLLSHSGEFHQTWSYEPFNSDQWALQSISLRFQINGKDWETDLKLNWAPALSTPCGPTSAPTQFGIRPSRK